MSLPIQSFRFREVAKAGTDFGGFDAPVDRTIASSVRAMGECFAFRSEPLNEEAQRDNISWHEWLLRRVVIGLWEEHSLKKVYVCYTLHPGVTRVFFCSHLRRFPDKFWRTMRETPAYIECGRDGFPMVYARSLAYWESPCSAVALWPRGLGGETEGARVLDTANLVAYFTYPESDHERGIAVDDAGPEYVRVPQEEHAEFKMGNTTYRYLNRWADGEVDLRQEL